MFEWTPNASRYATLYGFSDCTLGEDRLPFPPIAQESRRISHLSAQSANLRVFARLICIPANEAKSRLTSSVKVSCNPTTWGRVALLNSSLLLYGWVRISLNPIPSEAFFAIIQQSFCRAIRGGGPGWSRTNDVSNVTSLQPAAIATMLTDPCCRAHERAFSAYPNCYYTVSSEPTLSRQLRLMVTLPGVDPGFPA